MKKYALVVVIFAALPCAEARTDVSTGVTISEITVKQNGDQQKWTITMTGTTTLGTGCTLDTYQFYLERSETMKTRTKTSVFSHRSIDESACFHWEKRGSS